MRRLIESALPLDAINAAAEADKGRKTGTLRNIHKWFAPMPLPAWRALLFASLVEDPESEQERDRLLRIVEDLMASGGDLPSPSAVDAAKAEIEKTWPGGTPPVLDPFCGGGSTLVEAQRLGCRTYGSDLNPVPALITKFLTELLPLTAGAEPLHTDGFRVTGASRDPFAALASDCVRYAELARERVAARVAGLYGLSEAVSPIAWLWCRTARCPNPVCGATTLLTTSWELSKQRGNQRWLVPRVEGGAVALDIGGPDGAPPPAPKTARGASFSCVVCASPLDEHYLAAEGAAKRLGYRMTAVVQDIDGRRTFRVPSDAEVQLAQKVEFSDPRPVAMPDNPRWFSPPLFGFKTYGELFLPRQMQVLAMFAEEVASITATVETEGGTASYASAVNAFLALCVGKLAQASSTLVRWNVRNGPPPKAEPAFGRHDVPMTWDFAETNPFGGSVGDWIQIVNTARRAFAFIAPGTGQVRLADARSAAQGVNAGVLVATDPPYFDQIGYADLSDYFYPWLRRAAGERFPDLFQTIAAPKDGELVALPTRHGNDRGRARTYFVEGFTETFRSLRNAQHPDVPMLVVYAFKEQAADTGVAAGWSAVLEAVLAAELMVTGTWPVRGTGATRMVGLNTNALATYVVLVCRPRPADASRITKTEFVRELRAELKPAIAKLQHANIAPVDLAQAVIGPGMEIFSRHREVVETGGEAVGVAEALSLINRALAETLDEQEGDLDPDTRWAITWYEQYAYRPGVFGEADQLARAKGVSVEDLVRAGIVRSGGNKVALFQRDELAADWDPHTDRRATVWEAVQHLVRALAEQGESGAAQLYAQLGALADPARELAYRLFQVATRANAVDEALAYNNLVTSWSDIARVADQMRSRSTRALF